MSRSAGSTILDEAKQRRLFRLESFKKVDSKCFGTRILYSEKARKEEKLLRNITKQSTNVRKVVGIVCHAEKLEDGYSYGVQFAIFRE